MIEGTNWSDYPFLTVCSREPGNELVSPECLNLTGGTPDNDGVAPCQTVDYIQRAAYIHDGGRFLAAGATLVELIDQIKARDIHAEDFRVEFMRLTKTVKFHQQDAVLAAANAIHGPPDLSSPKRRFLLLVQEHRLLFSEILTRADHSYRKHAYKPFRTSNSLPSRLARALVNLVTPTARTILDPCCGTGSILLEAQSLGLLVYGGDRSPQAISMTRGNLAYFNYSGDVEEIDARLCRRNADALVTDLPYGRFVKSDLDGIQDILKNAVHLAPVAVYVAGSDISTWLQEAGYQDIEVFRLVKSGNFFRYIHRARSNG